MKCDIPDGDLHRKLHDTVCRYKGKPVYVQTDGSGRGGNLYISPITKRGSSNHTIIKKDDPDFDIASPLLGYVNVHSDQVGSRAIYMTRVPSRHVRQGLCSRQVKLAAIDGKQPGMMLSVQHVIYSKSFEDMMLDEYPKIEPSVKKLRKAFEEDNKSEMEIALTRNIAIKMLSTGVINVYFKMEPAGWIAPDDMIVNVPDKIRGWVLAQHLSEKLTWKVQE